MSILPGLQFGSGYVLTSPLSTVGNPAPTPTPMQIGTIQNIKFDIGGDIKDLFGPNQWPVDTAVGKRTIKGSFEFAQITNLLLSQLLTGDGTTTGVSQVVIGEAHQVPASSTYTVTVTNAASVPLTDYGVVYAATGLALTDVGAGSLTAAGQYKVNLSTGVYTFDSADASANILINYKYTLATTGTTLTAGNHQMGWGPVFGMDIWDAYEAGNNGLQGLGFYLPNVRMGKVSMTSKIDDYQMWTADFSAFAGPNGIPFVSYNID